jgi:hypothetical protein
MIAACVVEQVADLHALGRAILAKLTDSPRPPPSLDNPATPTS